MATPQIVFGDQALVCLVKPHLTPSQPDPSGDCSALEWASHEMGQELFTVNRLDRPVGGLLVLATSSRTAAALSRQFQERNVTKRYRAIVHGRLESRDGTMADSLRRNPKLNRSFTCDPERKGARKAQTRYRTLELRETISLVELEPLTGRHHQLRVQLSARGCPVLGDVKYGAKRSLRGRGIALFATSLELRHPDTGERLSLKAEPEGYPWEIFSRD